MVSCNETRSAVYESEGIHANGLCDCESIDKKRDKKSVETRQFEFIQYFGGIAFSRIKRPPML